MRASQEQELENWRILLFARRGDEMLLFRTPSGFRLPELQIPRWQRIAVHLNAEAKRVWGLDTVALFPLKLHLSDTSRAPLYHAMEACHSGDISRIAPRCVSVSSLDANSFVDSRDFVAVQQGMELEGVTAGEQPPFSQFGAFDKLCEWVRTQLESRALHWNGRFTQLQASGFFALVRFETDGHAVWFKAVGRPNEHEFLITTTLAARFPKFVPTILATLESCNGWLMDEVEGTLLLHSLEILDWEKAVVSLAELQIASISSSDEILSSGACDLRTWRLQKEVDPFFLLMRNLMRLQTKTTPPPLSETALVRLQSDLESVLSQFVRSEIPESLLHLDANPGNIIVTSSGCTFLDWAEAAIGNPFLTFQHVLEFFRQAHPDQPEQETFLAAAYANRWRRVVDGEQIEEAMHLIPAVAAFAQAVAVLARDHERAVGRSGKRCQLAKFDAANRYRGRKATRTKGALLIGLLTRMYFEFLRLEIPLARRDFSSIYRSVQSCRVSAWSNSRTTQADILRAADVAAVLYFKEVKCLQRSTAVAKMLRKQGFPAELVIGVQHLPFRAHAWVEIGGIVVNDKPYVSQMYAVIERC